jgi:NTE family protein
VVTAVDVLDGTRRVFDKTQGVPLERAVAASANPPGLRAPITIGDRRYMDGSVAGTHIDAAAGYRLVVGVIPGGGPGTDRQVEALRAQGSQVMIVRPDAESAAARGPDAQDVTRARGSAEAGYRQAALVVADLSNVWNGTSSSR